MDNHLLHFLGSDTSDEEMMNLVQIVISIERRTVYPKYLHAAQVAVMYKAKRHHPRRGAFE